MCNTVQIVVDMHVQAWCSAFVAQNACGRPVCHAAIVADKSVVFRKHCRARLLPIPSLIRNDGGSGRWWVSGMVGWRLGRGLGVMKDLDGSIDLDRMNMHNMTDPR